ncbi:MAG: DUF3568 family protein [Phycisphaeraceae bacterium]|nr:DUF3568 family protein [Phycisphaeraceae bacterium]MCB9847427.1 DUF3568 family protein [Phycisphaeraceae bacterium]
MKKSHRVAALFILAPIVGLASGGCWYVAAGAGAYAGYRFVDGEYKGVVHASLSDTARATRAAFKDLEIREKSVEQDSENATIKGVSTGDKDVSVRLERAGKNDTNIRVRIDVFGDQSYSQIVVDKINENL